MRLRPEQLSAHLAKGLGPLYLVYGDEPLLAIEAGDAIRAAARAAGCEEREVLVAEPGFKWDAFSAASRNLGLFGTRKLVDLRIPSGKPGVEGARVLEDCAAHPVPDTTTLITLPRVDRATLNSAWFAALENAVADVARFDVFQLSEAWLSGDAARACRILAALENEGEGIPLLLWQLGEDLHALAAVLALTASGTPVAIAVKSARVWGKRQTAIERAARRVAPSEIQPLLLRLARLDALAKGIGRGNVWDHLRDVALALAGRPALAGS